MAHETIQTPPTTTESANPLDRLAPRVPAAGEQTKTYESETDTDGNADPLDATEPWYVEYRQWLIGLGICMAVGVLLAIVLMLLFDM